MHSRRYITFLVCLAIGALSIGALVPSKMQLCAMCALILACGVGLMLLIDEEDQSSPPPPSEPASPPLPSEAAPPPPSEAAPPSRRRREVLPSGVPVAWSGTSGVPVARKEEAHGA